MLYHHTHWYRGVTVYTLHPGYTHTVSVLSNEESGLVVPRHSGLEARSNAGRAGGARLRRYAPPTSPATHPRHPFSCRAFLPALAKPGIFFLQRRRKQQRTLMLIHHALFEQVTGIPVPLHTKRLKQRQ